MELSYVARTSGMTPLILGENHVSPLKSALKNHESDKATKRKNIHFKTPETTSEVFVTPENSYSKGQNNNKIKCHFVCKILISNFLITI